MAVYLLIDKLKLDNAVLLKKMILSDHFTACFTISAYVGFLRMFSTLSFPCGAFCAKLELFKSLQFSTVVFFMIKTGATHEAPKFLVHHNIDNIDIVYSSHHGFISLLAYCSFFGHIKHHYIDVH